MKSCPTWFSSELNRKLHLKSIHGFRQGHCKSYFRVYLLLEIYLSQDSFARPATRHSISSGKAELREFSPDTVTDHGVGIVTPPNAEHGTVPCSVFGGQG